MFYKTIQWEYQFMVVVCPHARRIWYWTLVFERYAVHVMASFTKYNNNSTANLYIAISNHGRFKKILLLEFTINLTKNRSSAFPCLLLYPSINCWWNDQGSTRKLLALMLIFWFTEEISNAVWFCYFIMFKAISKSSFTGWISKNLFDT